MKQLKTLLLLLILTISSSLYSQDKYDQFMMKMDVENEIKTMVNNYIDQLARRSDSINENQWEGIKSKIDYSAYFLGIKSVLMNNYTVEEIDDIFAANDMVSSINDTGKFIYKPKPEVTEQMYKISKTFGKLLNVQIKKLIQKL